MLTPLKCGLALSVCFGIVHLCDHAYGNSYSTWSPALRGIDGSSLSCMLANTDLEGRYSVLCRSRPGRQPLRVLCGATVPSVWIALLSCGIDDLFLARLNKDKDKDLTLRRRILVVFPLLFCCVLVLAPSCGHGSMRRRPAVANHSGKRRPK